MKSFEKEDLMTGQKIVIFGAGAYGELALRGLEHLGLRPTCFADRVWSGTKYLDIEVIHPDELTDYISDVILIATYNYFYEIKTYLESIGANYYFDIYKLILLDIPKEKLSEYALDEKGNVAKYKNVVMNQQRTDKLIVNHCEIVITEKCTLRCKDCCNLIQYYQKPENLNMDEIVSAFDNFLDVVDGVLDLRVLGGEAFICRDIDKLLNRYSDNGKVHRIVVYTNATIIPTSKVMESLKGEKIKVHMSNYGINQSKVEEIERIFKSEHIDYYIHEYEDWHDVGTPEKRDYTQDEVMQMYQSCVIAKCHTFYRGRFYLCSRAGHAVRLGFVQEKEDEYVDFNMKETDRELLRSQLIKLMDKNYTSTCFYCKGSNRCSGKVPAGRQIEERY